MVSTAPIASPTHLAAVGAGRVVVSLIARSPARVA
jgi:hypothetical protein